MVTSLVQLPAINSLKILLRMISKIDRDSVGSLNETNPDHVNFIFVFACIFTCE